MSMRSPFDECIDPTFKKEVLEDAVKKQIALVNQSYYKYGPCRDNFGGGRVDALGSADLCLAKFGATQNQEYLLDALNYILFRLMFPYPGDFLQHTDSDQSAGTVGIPINMEDDAWNLK